ncbi:Rop family plasmid primer RNA-binding protein, partial [Enterobacter hormaechei]|uniref:Rop family plasmid primer RNA-binding protein n=1 Tax=Enterobacter hormaechei TaxID=158836 RepID=UPI0028752A59
MTSQESAALNLAKFIRSQTLLLLERLEQMDLDVAAGCCEHLHDLAEALYAMLYAQIGETDA